MKLIYLTAIVCIAQINMLAAETQSNVILIVTAGRGCQDLGCFGSKAINAPPLDRMATGGLRLTSFSDQPVCTVPPAALMTDSYPIRVGESGNIKRPGTVPRSKKITIAEVQEPGDVNPAGDGARCFDGGERNRQVPNQDAPARARRKQPPRYNPSVPKPTLTNVRYGQHNRNVVDFWRADSETPTPLVFVIHGGGWRGGSKELIHKFADVRTLLDAGVSVAAINYRFVTQAGKTTPPVRVPLYDAARALQFVRSKAKEWNIDKQRIGAAGGSAGACSSLWLAFHDDLANTNSDDPVARESSRLWCAAVVNAQTSLDPKQMKQWTPNSKYGGHAFGKGSFKEFLSDRESILPWIKEYSPYALVTKDDPPVYIKYGGRPAIGKKAKDPTHTANFGVKLQEHCEVVGSRCEVFYPGASGVRKSPTVFLIETLKGKTP